MQRRIEMKNEILLYCFPYSGASASCFSYRANNPLKACPCHLQAPLGGGEASFEPSPRMAVLQSEGHRHHRDAGQEHCQHCGARPSQAQFFGHHRGVHAPPAAGKRAGADVGRLTLRSSRRYPSSDGSIRSV